MPLSNHDLERQWHRGIYLVRREIVVPTVGGTVQYNLPMGCWYNDRPDDTSLEIDKGSGWETQVLGADYIHRTRTVCPPSVADMAFGWILMNSPADGWAQRFRWNEWKIRDIPQSILPVYVATPGSEEDYSVAWKAFGLGMPNAVRVYIPENLSWRVEFWRRTRRIGGARPGGRWSGGRRYVPYWRAPAGRSVFHHTEFCACSTVSRWKFKVCYYDEMTGARSALSSFTIVVNANRPDRIETAGLVRGPLSVWVEG